MNSKTVLILSAVFLLFFGCSQQKDVIKQITQDIRKTVSEEDAQKIQSLCDQMLKAKSLIERTKAADALLKYKKKNIPFLVDTFERTTVRTEEGRSVRVYLAKMLAGTEEGITILKEYTKKESVPKKFFGLTGLVYTKDKDIFLPFIVKALGDTDERIRKYALGVLVDNAKDRGEAILGDLVKYLQDSSFGVRMDSALAIKNLGLKQAEGQLRDAFKRELTRKDTKLTVKIAMAGALFRLSGDQQAKDFLLRVLTSSKNLTVENLGFLRESLKGIKEKQIYKALIGLLSAGDYQVRNAAITWLFDLTGQTFGYNSVASEQDRNLAVKKWQDWLNSQQ